MGTAQAESKHLVTYGATPAAAWKVHPRLRGGQPCPPHCFSEAQMEVIEAFCDAIFPSITLEQFCKIYPSLVGGVGDGDGDGGDSQLSKAEMQDLETYLLLSAKEDMIPLEVAGHLSQLMKNSQLRLLRLALWTLSTRLGTLALGGKEAFTWTFPFCQRFAKLSNERRQRFLRRLGLSCITFKQEIFRCVTGFIPWIVFTTVDSFGFNPTFPALRYSIDELPSPPLDMKPNTETQENCFDETPTFTPMETLHSPNQETSPTATQKFAPSLPSRVIDAAQVGAHLASELANRGFPLLDNVAHLKALQRSKSFKKPSHMDIGVKCKIVVIGSGAGGSVVAAKLAQAGYSVLILEKGQYFPGAEVSNLEGPSFYAMYEEGGCLITDDSRMMLLAGTTVGGGSTINWSASFRTPSHVRKEWAEAFHLDLFASQVYDHAMDEVCSRLAVQSEVAHENFQNGVLRAGCEALGFHVDNIPRNSPPDHQCGFCGMGCKQEKKRGAMVTWLEDAAAAGAVVVASCKAEEVLCARRDSGRRKVAGVVAQVKSGHKLIAVYVEADVVVTACGALWTPPLLRKSGLCNPAIGKNLRVHPVQFVWGHFEEGTGMLGESYRGGIMTAYSKVVANWDTTGYGAVIQCTASQPGNRSIFLPWVSGVDFKARMLKFARTPLLLVLVRDSSGGQVSIDEDERLCVRYQLSATDKESSRNGTEKALRILVAAGAQEVGTCDIDMEAFAPCSATEEEFDAYLARVRGNSFKKLGTTVVSAHQMGSCRMGATPLVSAVQPSGETWEVQGLYVADSSVFPTALGLNPMITVQSIAFCISDSIRLHLQHCNKKQE